jgi:putative transposase
LTCLLQVSASGFYDWVKRPPSRWLQEEARLELEIRAAEKRSRHTYGPIRLQKELAEKGIRVGICRIRRIRKKLGLRCIQIKKFKATTYSKHNLPVAVNLVKQQFEVSAPDQVWVSDITYISTDEGWLYLAGHKDLYTRLIVGYAMGERMTSSLIQDSLLQALISRHPAKGLVHHSDRGKQYCSAEFKVLLEKYGIQASMSDTGNCYDNAPMESFWGILKQELVHHHHFQTRLEAQRAISEYINIFYNRQRLQASLKYLSPTVFDLRWQLGLIKI